MINTDVSYYISGWSGSLIEYICLLIDIDEQRFYRNGLSPREWEDVSRKRLFSCQTDTLGRSARQSPIWNFPASITRLVTGDSSRHFWNLKLEIPDHFRIKDISQSVTAANHSFVQKDNNNSNGPDVEITLVEYYRKRYGINLKFPNMPCVVVEKKEKLSYFPLELVNLPGYQFSNDMSGEFYIVVDDVWWRNMTSYSERSSNDDREDEWRASRKVSTGGEISMKFRSVCTDSTRSIDTTAIFTITNHWRDSISPLRNNR